MKKNQRWISIRLICITCVFAFCINHSYSQQLWGMTSDGGGKKTGGNIFSINADGTGFIERYQFFNDAEYPSSQRLLDYGDGYLYGVARDILFRHHYDGSGYEAVYAFQKATGYLPSGRLLKGLDGFLYGAAMAGGNNENGVIYKVNKNGSAYQVLHYFNFTDGEFPCGNLIQFNNGLICGVTESGGSYGGGTIFHINPDGTGFQSLHSFNGTDGDYPDGGVVSLTVNNNTYIYGVTKYGGTNQRGVIYRIKTDGTNYSRQYNFSSNSGQFPSGQLIKIGNILYGVTSSGGNHNGGVLFAYDADADDYQKLHQFTYDPNNSADESFPTAPLLNISGVLYGITKDGGSKGLGVLYKLNADGTGYQVIHEYDEYIQDGNLLYANNQIYGLTAGTILNHYLYTHGTIYKLNIDGTSFQTLHSFNDHNGYGPSGSLILGKDGKLYGVATYGGGEYSNGLAFSIETDGSNYTPRVQLGDIYQGGSSPGSMIQATNGIFYGIKPYDGNGKIYRLSMSGPFSSLQYYDPFCAGFGCAAHPIASPLQASDGNLYGMTPESGNSSGKGDIYRISTSGTGYAILKEFNGTNGADPAGSLIQAPDGYLYGMTENGGLNGFGVIFKIRMDGTGFQKLFEFGSNMNGIYGTHPKGTLLLGSDGKLYGMAYAGGTGWGGTLFRINTNGTGFTVIFNFNSTTGWFPVASLVEDVNTGFLFGMTEQGGTSNFGTIFKIRKDGTGYQTLLNFNGTNGKYPKGDLLIVQPGTPPPQPIPITAAEENNSSKKNTIITTFPNPVKQSFTIRFQKQLSGRVVYSLADLSGRKLIEKTFDRPVFTEIKSIDISSLPSGTYLLELRTPIGKFTQKIVKQ